MLGCVLCTPIHTTYCISSNPFRTPPALHWYFEASVQMVLDVRNRKKDQWNTVTDTVVHISLTSSWLATVSSLQWLQATFLNGQSPSTWLPSFSAGSSSLHPGLGHFTGLYLQSRQWPLRRWYMVLVIYKTDTHHKPYILILNWHPPQSAIAVLAKGSRRRNVSIALWVERSLFGQLCPGNTAEVRTNWGRARPVPRQ